MDDKKRKKFGLSLKNSKKLAVPKSEVKNKGSFSYDPVCHKNSKEEPIFVGLDDEEPANYLDLKECDSIMKIKRRPNLINGFEAENENFSNNDEEERTLWRNLFSGNISVSWETLEDLPTFDASTTGMTENTCKTSSCLDAKKKERKSIKIEKDNDNIDLDSSTTHTKVTEIFNIELDYEDLPKPCFACYTRKAYPLIYSQKDEITEDKIIQKDPSCSQRERNDSASKCPDSILLSKSTMAINKISSTNKPCSAKLFQKSNENCKAESLRSQGNNVKSGATLNQKTVEKKPILQNNSYKEKTLKNNDGCHFFEEKNNPTSSFLHQKSTATFIDLTEDINSEQRFSNKKGKFGMMHINAAPTNLHSDINSMSSKPNNCENPKKPLRFITTSGLVTNNDVKMFNSGKEIPKKKEILNFCPMCQFQFPQKMDKQGIDLHISKCIGNEAILDDDDEDW